jgi:hypothetical protein
MGEDMVAVKITAKEVKIPQKGAAWSGPSCPRRAIVSNAINLILRHSFFLYPVCSSTFGAST